MLLLMLCTVWAEKVPTGTPVKDLRAARVAKAPRAASEGTVTVQLAPASTNDTLHLRDLANYIDFQALYNANPDMVQTTVTSTTTVTLPNGSILRGLQKSDGTEVANSWNTKDGYNSAMPTPEWEGVEALIVGTMFRAGKGSSISLGAFKMNTAGKLTVYFSPNGDADRGVKIVAKSDTTEFLKNGTKIDGVRPLYAAEIALPAGYYEQGDVEITVLKNTTNIYGVRIDPEPEIGNDTLPNVPTEADLAAAGYDTENNIVLCFYFDEAPCNDVVITGNYNGWSTSDIASLVHMTPLNGFDGWYAAEIPYNTNGGTWDNQAKPVHLSNDGSLNWDYQAGDINAWTHRGGQETEFEIGFNECTPYLSNPGAYIYEIAYWKNSYPCDEVIETYTVYFEAPQGAPESVEIIGTFDSWTGTAMSYDAQNNIWVATIEATASYEFRFREAGNWDNQIQYRNSATGEWNDINNLTIRDYLYPELENVVYVNFSDASQYRWTASTAGTEIRYGEIWPVILDNTTKSSWSEKIQYDFTSNENDINLYIWDGTYSPGAASGLNFYGNTEGYLSLVVGNQGWSGAGLSVSGNSLSAATSLLQAIQAEPEKYYLHMAIKSTDNYAHAFYLFGNEGTKFVLGDHSVYEGPVLGDFARDGEWHEINMPMSLFAESLSNTGISSSGMNLFTMLSEGVQGAQLDLDAVFIGKEQGPIELTVSSIASQFYSEDNDIYYELTLNDEAGSYFTIDIILPEGMKDVELGQVYTWDNMLQQYCYGSYNGRQINYSAVQFVKTEEEGGVRISMSITATDGQEYILTYVGADATPYDYDATEGYAENFSNYTATLYENNIMLVQAQNANNARIGLVFVLPAGNDTLVAGTYTISADSTPMTVWASEGLVGGIKYSYAGYYSSEGYISIPIWFLVGGSVNVAEDGTITLNGVNSKGYSVVCTLTAPEEQPVDTSIPTEADLAAAGYDLINNVVLAFQFDVAPCYDVVIAGNYAANETGWFTNPDQLVHMQALAGFEGWFVAELPYFEDIQAKPIQLNDLGNFSWDNQAGDSWIYKGGNTADIYYSGISGEVDLHYPSAGAYIYEIEYWKNGHNACEQTTGTYTVLFKAPDGAPESVEIIGGFDNWTGTAMSYNATSSLWEATITATNADEFKFRKAGTWDTEIQVYDSEYDSWKTCNNLKISDYLLGSSVVYVDFSNADQYRWTPEDLSHLYIPYNLQAVSEPGKVVFTWEAEEVSDTYLIHVYDVSEDAYLGYLTAYGATSLTYMVQEFLDGKEIRWSVQPVSPYELYEVYAGNTFVMHKSDVELSNFVLTTEDGVTLDLTWESNITVPLYRVQVYGSGGLLWTEIVNSPEFHYTSSIPGTMDVYVWPLNAEGEDIGRYSYAGSIDLSAVPVPFENLQAEANEHVITATWSGAAESVIVQIFRMEDGSFTNLIYEGVVSGHSVEYTVAEDGNYAVQLCAWGEFSPGEYGEIPYYGYVIVQAFTVPTYSVQINAGEGGYVWPNGMSGNYPEGYVLTVEAYAYEGYVFSGWSDGVNDNPRTIIVDGELSITAQFTLEEELPTGLDDVSEGQSAQKVFKNGQIYILRGGKTYTVQGQAVR